jgi:nucleoside-diphosphate-sugar epimerase
MVTKDKKRVRPEKSEVERLFSDSRKAKALFGWNPEIDIEEGIRKTISWMEKNIDRYKEEIYNI